MRRRHRRPLPVEPRLIALAHGRRRYSASQLFCIRGTRRARRIGRQSDDRDDSLAREYVAQLLVGGGVKLPALQGLTTEEATALLEGLGFEVELARTVDSDLPEGAVVRTNPEEGLLLAKGMTIKLIVSRGNQAIMPNVSDRTMSEAQATAALHALGFNNLNIVCTPSINGAAPAFGTVVSQSPSSGVSMFFTRQVTLTVYRETC